MHGGRPSTTSLGQSSQYIQAAVYTCMKTWFVHFGINYGFLVNIHFEPTRPGTVSQFFRQYQQWQGVLGRLGADLLQGPQMRYSIM